MDRYSVFECLSQKARAVRGLTAFDGDVALTLWQRNQASRTVYRSPNHHTLSLYLAGGRQIRRRCGRRLLSGGQPGILCIMPAGEDSDWDVAGPVEMLHFYFSDRDIEAAVGDEWRGNRRIQEATFVREPIITDLMRALLRLDWDRGADRIVISHLALSLIALVLKVDGENGGRTRKGGLPPRVLCKINEFIQANMDKALTVSELASLSGLSPFHFSRAFREATGLAPHRYVMQRRIERAAALIKLGDKPLAEIALETGHSSQSHLARRFREQFGVSPTDYAHRSRFSPRG